MMEKKLCAGVDYGIESPKTDRVYDIIIFVAFTYSILIIIIIVMEVLEFVFKYVVAFLFFLSPSLLLLL